ncbi:LOW QUALITY PROTEIN: hypothetical protein Cgig2_002366 [Carnegiea gigantea]|uniref:Uncharacterized protein n=1 Tax=Carnegiea gigantea TaxID=171969 RepID=A0A9Q1KEM8_9CARY|nr:LOW QUALITY PROTEIN: hypothetical protein Cgig2_002366 [Carnegiea gigantea]
MMMLPMRSQFIGAAESRSPHKRVHTSLSEKVKVEVQVIAMGKGKNYLTGLDKIEGACKGCCEGSDFVFGVIEYIMSEEDADYFVVQDNEDVCRYLQVRGFGYVTKNVINTLLLYTLQHGSSQAPPSPHERLSKMIGDESGTNFNHRVLQISNIECCVVIVMTFIANFCTLNEMLLFISIMIERELLYEVEIVATTLFIFIRGVCYRDVEIEFVHSPSTISKYHN